MADIPKASTIPYPLATKSQEVIPHEVAAPAGCYKIAIQAGASYVIEAVPDIPIIAIIASGDVFAVFSDSVTVPTLIQGEAVASAMICKAGTTVIGKPKKANLILINESTDTAIVVYVQLLYTWNILGTAQQTTRI